jgi:hypothetical protein
MKISRLKEQIRGIIRERSIKAIQKDYSNVVSDMEKHLELYKKSKGTPEEKKHIGHLKDLTAKKKKLQSELDLAVANLYKNAELKVDEAITNPKKTNPSELAKTVLGWFDFYTDYIDDGGQRRRAIKNNEDTLVWFGSHPKDVKEKAYKIMLSQSKDKGQIERNFGKHLKESVIKEDTRRVKLLGIDFKVSEMNGRIFFSFVDKKAATIQLRQVGTNKIVNHIQNRLDIAYGKGEFFFKSGDHAEFQNGYLFQRNPSNINLNKIKFESVNEGLYHVGYNKGRGQGTGVFKDSYSSYKDAKKAVEKLEKERGGSYNMVAYYVSDKDGKFVRESVNEAKSDYPVYHYTYTSAIQSARDYAEKKGYEIDDEDAFRKIGMGPRKPSDGKTNRFSIELTKNGKPQKKMLHIQVYGMGTYKRAQNGSKTRSLYGGQNEYELNCYIN